MPQTGEGQGAGTSAPQLSSPTTLGALPVVGWNWNVSCRRGRGGGQVTPVQGAACPQCHWLGEHRQAGDTLQPGERGYKKHSPPCCTPTPSFIPWLFPIPPLRWVPEGPPSTPFVQLSNTGLFLYHCRE